MTHSRTWPHALKKINGYQSNNKMDNSQKQMFRIYKLYGVLCDRVCKEKLAICSLK